MTTAASTLPEGIIEVTERSLTEKVKDFSELLQSIESLDDKKRKLWTEIYENAIADRQNAYVMFTTLVRIVKDVSGEHAVHARSINSFIERMQRANEQLIKLADLIAAAQRKDESIDANDMFDQINKGR